VRGVGRAALCPVAVSDLPFLLRRRCRSVRVFPSGSMIVWMIAFVSLAPRSSGFPLAWNEKRSGCSRRCSPMLYSATEPFDTGSAAGRMMLQMLGVFAEFEHATIVDRVTSGIERRAREGRWPNGRIPFGYLRNDRKELVLDERTTPDTATLQAVADRLDHVIAHGEPEQAKALLGILIADLRINSRNEVLPTYRIGAPTVCAPTSSVELVGVLSNHDLQGALGRLTEKLAAVRAGCAPAASMSTAGVGG
jgi:hypothetical protein